MFVIDVIPFSKAAPVGTLSYRSRTALTPGTLVSVMLRRSRTVALVVECESALERKSSLKRASFMLSTSEPIPEGSLPTSLMNAAQELSLLHAAPLGSVLMALLGEYIRAESSLEVQHHAGTAEGFSTRGVEGSVDVRAEEYEKVISGYKQKSRAIHMIVPTLAEVFFWQKRFAHHSPLILSSASASKNRIATIQKVRSSTGLVITTPSYVWVPMEFRGLYVLDRVSAGSYCMPKRPYLNLFTAAQELARASQFPLWYGDYPLPLELRPDPIAPIPYTDTPSLTAFDARDPDDQEEKKPWRAIPVPLLEKIDAERTKGNRVAVLAVRKGYSPTVVCRDCGQSVTDERGLLLSFSQEGGERVMRSSDGHTIRPADIHCTRCGSWNLYPLGVGIERVEEELHKAFPDAQIVSFAAETIRTRAQALTLVTAVEAPGSIVIGTESMLPWLMLVQDMVPISLGIIASADSLLSLPFWRSRERFIRLALLFSSIASTTVLSTRRPDDTVFSIFASTKATVRQSFFQEEFALRKALTYPPFGTLILLQIEGSKNFLELEQERIVPLLTDTKRIPLSDRALSQTTFRRSWVITLAQNEWPNTKLSHTLQLLGPSVRILIDPESLW